MFESILCQVTEYDPDVLESLIGLAVEIAREGREGRRVGTLFTLGDENAVLARSRPLILDPLSGHPESSLHVTNLNLRGTIKELAQLDGGFVVSREGIVLSACRYLDAVAAPVDVPLGLGSRHIAAAKHECCHQGGGYCGFREFGSATFLSWTTGRRNHPRGLDDGSCRPPARYREKGTSRRNDDSDTKSATSPDHEVSMTNRPTIRMAG